LVAYPVEDSQLANLYILHQIRECNQQHGFFHWAESVRVFCQQSAQGFTEWLEHERQDEPQGQADVNRQEAELAGILVLACT